MDVQLLKQLADARERRMAVAVLTDIASGEQELVTRRYAGEHPLAEQLDEAFRFDKSGVLSTG